MPNILRRSGWIPAALFTNEAGGPAGLAGVKVDGGGPPNDADPRKGAGPRDDGAGGPRNEAEPRNGAEGGPPRPADRDGAGRRAEG